MDQEPGHDPHVKAGKHGSLPGSPFLVLGVLLFVYILNFADRVLLGVMAVPIKEDLGLSDTELGLLGGTAFALFYATLGVPIAWLADRKSRSWIITIALATWSGFTALCAAAVSFPQLFLARLGVGVGEAGGVAPSYSLIADYFPPGQRARALGFYSFGIPIGSAVGLAFGGLMATAFDWRTAFLTMGLLGITIAPVFKFIVRDPVRGGLDVKKSRSPSPVKFNVRETASVLKSKPSFWLLSLGSAMSATASYGITFWIPSFYVRSFSLSLADVSLIYASLILVGGLAGTWIGANLGDKFGPQRPAAYVLIPVVALLVSVPFFVGAVSTGNLYLSLSLLAVPTALGGMGYGTILTAIQHIVPPALRSTGSSIFLLINNLIGLGLGSLILGVISDAMTQQYGSESLRYALLCGSSFYVVGALLFFLASRKVAADWELAR
ncbi:MAG: MFS transporter [Pseudomonadales bacterium]|nr:MFS transporter [Pseudomonadales bacterium]